MNNTLIISESHYGTTRKVSYYLSLLLGFSKNIDIEYAPDDIEKYDNIIFLFCFYGNRTAEKLTSYLNKIKSKLDDKKVILIGVGIDKTNLEYYTSNILKIINRKILNIDFIPGDLIIEKLNEEDKSVLEEYFKKNNMEFKNIRKFNIQNVIDVFFRINGLLEGYTKKLERDDLYYEIDKFIGLHNTCALSTGYGDYIRSTPIEYIYYKRNFYFITEGGLKFVGILQNPNVSICIYDNYKAMNKLAGLQIRGISEIIPIGTKEYYELMKQKNLTEDSLKKFHVNLNLIKVYPEKFEFMNSEFAKKGYDIKQILNI